LNNQRGVVLTVVIVVSVILVLAAGYIMGLGYNQKRIMDQLSGRRMRAYYRAQGGMVDALFRLRTNSMGLGLGGVPTIGGTGGPPDDFTNPNFDPQPYFINVKTDTASTDGSLPYDVKVDIGPVQQAPGLPDTGFRKIELTGKDDT